MLTIFLCALLVILCVLFIGTLLALVFGWTDKKENLAIFGENIVKSSSKNARTPNLQDPIIQLVDYPIASDLMGVRSDLVI